VFCQSAERLAFTGRADSVTWNVLVKNLFDLSTFVHHNAKAYLVMNKAVAEVVPCIDCFFHFDLDATPTFRPRSSRRAPFDRARRLREISQLDSRTLEAPAAMLKPLRARILSSATRDARVQNKLCVLKKLLTSAFARATLSAHCTCAQVCLWSFG
jgi:hypothetical protein